ncbi:MAG: FAD-dependent oxidoreductase, partial [Saprospiraceae bacterium]|nr:FAD-dependent oxidoreductase [Saprospiraceae bacterium]
MSKKIAIAGGGISGLSAAWMLKKSGFEVTVYEEKAYPGGHIEMFEFEVGGQMEKCHMNPGHFRLSPHIIALSKLWDLPMFEQEFGIYYHHGDESWATFSHSDFFLAHAEECQRFTALMKELHERDAAAEASATTLYDFMAGNGFSKDFMQHIFSPVLSWVFGDIRKNDIYQISLVHVVELFATGIFSFFESTSMLRFPRGGQELLEKLVEPRGKDILLNTQVEKVVRDERGVLVIDSKGGQRQYDEIILSVNFEIILGILDTLDPIEASILN